MLLNQREHYGTLVFLSRLQRISSWNEVFTVFGQFLCRGFFDCNGYVGMFVDSPNERGSLGVYILLAEVLKWSPWFRYVYPKSVKLKCEKDLVVSFVTEFLVKKYSSSVLHYSTSLILGMDSKVSLGVIAFTIWTLR